MGEKRVAFIVKEVLDGLAYLHDNRVVHRDLKPENIMLISNQEGETFAKIVDFGLADYNNITLKKGAGTPIYMAPEIVSSKVYSEKVDIWSVGVITYLLLSGRPPFNGKDRAELFHNIKRGEPSFAESGWSRVSRACK